MLDLHPRKQPCQARSRVTVDAILDACARLLREGGYAALTTNHIAECAGVSIGTLYEFFPSKEAIVAALIERRLEDVVGEVARRLEEVLAMGLQPQPSYADGGGQPMSEADEWNLAEFLIRGLVDLVSSDGELYRVLVREVPFGARLPAMQRALATLFDLARCAGERAADRLDLPHVEADSWLIARMVYQAVLEIAFTDEAAPDRELLTRELVRLTARMIWGTDPDDPERGRGRSAAGRRPPSTPPPAAGAASPSPRTAPCSARPSRAACRPPGSRR